MLDDLTALIRTLRSHLWIVVGAVVAVVLGAVVYLGAAQTMYRAEAVLTFNPRPRANPSADLVRLVVGSKYAEYAASSTALGNVGRAIDTDPAVLERALEVTVPTNSASLEIAFEMPSPAVAADAANALAGDLTAFSQDDALLRGYLVGPAEIPDSPTGPSSVLIVGVAAVLGLAAGCGLALITEQLWPRLRTVGEVGEVAGVPVIGMLPSLPAGEHVPPAAAANDSDFGRQLRILRTNLVRRGGHEPVALAVVSANEGDGRTTVALHLAAAVATTDARVLVIDGDVHHPAIRERLGIPDGPGFVEAVTEGARIMPVAYEPVPGLYVLGTRPAVNASDAPPGHIDNLLKRASDLFDLVVLDTPALLSTDEARTLAAAADDVLLVCGLGGSTADLEESVAALKMIGANVVGVVINRATARPVPRVAESASIGQ